MTKITDCELIYNVLKDGQWHNAVDICLICKPNAVNWALRSRISDLKKKLRKNMVDIKSKIDTNGCAKYRFEFIQPKQQDLI